MTKAELLWREAFKEYMQAHYVYRASIGDIPIAQISILTEMALRNVEAFIHEQTREDSEHQSTLPAHPAKPPQDVA